MTRPLGKPWLAFVFPISQAVTVYILIKWQPEWLIVWFAWFMTDWLVDYLLNLWLSGRLFLDLWLTGRLFAWFIAYWLVDCLLDLWPNDWLSVCLIYDWLVDGLLDLWSTAWLIVCLIYDWWRGFNMFLLIILGDFLKTWKECCLRKFTTVNYEGLADYYLHYSGTWKILLEYYIREHLI